MNPFGNRMIRAVRSLFVPDRNNDKWLDGCNWPILLKNSERFYNDAIMFVC
jgi:hypothetical protein